MEKNTLFTLEWDKIRDKLIDNCQSSLGKGLASKLEPIYDIEEIRKLLNKTKNGIELILKYSNPPLFGIYDFEYVFKRLGMGAILENSDFIKISDSLRVASRLKEYVSEYEGENELVNNIKLLYTNKRVEEEINRIIVDEDTIADDASRTLLSIRRSIKNKMDEIKRKLNSIIQDKENQLKIQDGIITVRDGRYVVPVKREAKSHFKGITHDQSATGQTVYIEPMVVVELNNDIRKLEVEEQDEIRRILKDLSELVATYREDIYQNQFILSDLDFTFAKSKLALSMDANLPIMNTDKIVDIKSARHPLLKGRVVPIDVKLGDGYNALVITGPNTGGKTVSLKTLGLMIIMAQSGLFIPCAEFSKIPVIKNIYTDIGDKQSIELSLSTFSASMTNIVSILEKADDKSLVLFDELGSGTDPTEGAALAMSIIDNLVKRDVLLVTTTHYSELKLYAMTTQGVQNASVEFDIETLSPTYRLIIGTPGKSNAFEISKRLGLKDEILSEAKKYVSKENKDFEEIISDIESDRIKMEQELSEVRALKLEYRRLNEKLNSDIGEKLQKALDEIESSKELAREILENAKAESKEILKFAKKSMKGSTSELDRAYSEITNKYKDMSVKYQKKEKTETHQGGDIEVKLGETVRIISMDDIGIVQTLPDSRGDLMVQVGILKFSANIRDLEKAQEQRKEKNKAGYRSVLQNKSKTEIRQELDLRGKNVLESIPDIEKFFDDSIILGMKTVNIIHGKGTGALREGITNFLKKSKYVESFRLGELKEGGAGVTVVTLK
ncbi:MAG: endonuclease MutS2 [Tissierellia bacterium]|nr:endonuclease MutS2 [Tissierellia bacterium]